MQVYREASKREDRLVSIIWFARITHTVIEETNYC